MKQMYRTGFVLAVLSMSLFSCKDKTEILESVDTSISGSATQQGELSSRDQFSRALAKALRKKEVRSFLKSEALKKYDGDYDIVYSFVKSKLLSNGLTFEQEMMKALPSETIENWSEAAPLLTIFVPELTGFSAETWDLETQVPNVVIDNTHLKGKQEVYKAYSDTQEYEVSSKVAPSSPVVVVKENERIISKSKLNAKARKDETLFEQKSNQTINENSTHSFYFIGDVDPKIYDKKNKREERWEDLPPQLSYGGFNHVENQRDWTYYHIAPKFEGMYSDDYDYTKGTYANNYTEKITGFKFKDEYAAAVASDSWTDGSYEFHILVSFMSRSGTIQTDLKPWYVYQHLLMYEWVPQEVNPDIELMGWDMYRYGDEWKISVLEHDPSGTMSKTISAKSTFGSNFTANLIKLGIGLGFSVGEEVTASTVITIAQEDDELGDARILYNDPVLTSYNIYSGNVGKWTINTINTNAVILTIQPVIKYGTDNRPYPN